MALLRWLTLSVVASFVLGAASVSEVHGIVVDAISGQPLVAALRVNGLNPGVSSDSSGHFAFRGLDLGDYRIEVAADGHQTAFVDLHVSPDAEDLTVAVAPLLLPHRDSVSVKASASSLDAGSGDQFSLGHVDMKNLSTVLADDPLRALQALPGVASNDDFQARFSLRGADFSRIGVYLDGIELHNAVHNLEGTDLSGSASSFNPEVVGELDLHEGAFSERFADSSNAALEIRLRDPDEGRYSFRAIANLGSAGVTASGPFGKWNRCSWTGGFRKSYLQYLLAQTLTDPSMAFGIEDGEGRVACRVSDSNQLSVDVIDSYTDLDRSSVQKDLGANALMLAAQHSTTVNVGWLYSPNARLTVDSHAALLQDNFDDANALRSPVGQGQYREWVANSTASWMWNAHDALSAGVSTRQLNDAGFQNTFDTFQQIQLTEQYRGTGTLSGGFLEESWSAWGNRIHLFASGRWDHHSIDGITAFSPQTAVSLALSSSTNLHLGWGQYVQFPEVSQFGSNLGSRALLPTRSNQSTITLEQRLGQNTHLQAEFYNRQDRDLLYRPFLDPRILDGLVFIPPPAPLYFNSLRGYGRGIELSLRQTTHRGLTGWISYAYGRTGMHDGVTGDFFPSNWDQRHTVNAYASYRLRPSVNLSSRWTYGSGFPIPGYLAFTGPIQNERFSLIGQRNQARVGPYQRWDVRMNKTWDREKWKKTLYVEVMNVTNRTNYRFGSLDGFNRYGTAYVSVDQMFPILPSVGFVLER